MKPVKKELRCDSRRLRSITRSEAGRNMYISTYGCREVGCSLDEKLARRDLEAINLNRNERHYARLHRMQPTIGVVASGR
jgi:hypothetical protein